jgi:hypothetical protein
MKKELRPSHPNMPQRLGRNSGKKAYRANPEHQYHVHYCEHGERST